MRGGSPGRSGMEPGTGTSRWLDLRQALFNGNGIARRLLLAVVAFSSLITAIITAQDLYAGYRSDLREISGAFQFVEASYAPSVSRSVWQFDEELVRSQLQGMLRLPDVEFAEVLIDGQPQWSVGKVTSTRQLRTQIPLLHSDPRGPQTIGMLLIVASADRALARVWQRLGFELLTNGIKTLLVAGFLLLVFQYLVTRHLTQVAHFVRAIDPGNPGASPPTLKLDRPARGRWRPDILDAVTASINGMLESLRAARASLDESHQKLADSELRMRLGLEAAGAGVWDCDLVTRRIFANEECARLLGLVPSEMQTQPSFWRELVHPDDLDHALMDLRRHSDGATPHAHAQFRMRHAQLGWRWMSLQGRVIERGPDGAPLRAVGTMVDITQRRRADDAIRQSEARLRSLTAHASALIYEVDAQGRIIFANRESSLLGTHIVGSFAAQWLPADQRIRFDECLREAINHGSRESFELQIHDERGNPRQYKLTVAPMRSPHVMSAVVTALDITDIKAAEAALRDANSLLESRVRERTAALEAARDDAQRANQAKSEFLSRMSHELRTPMNAILGFAQILEMAGLGAQPMRWSREIRQAGEHLLQLIDELLDLARIEVGRLNIRLEPVELQPVIEEAASLCEALLRMKRVTLDLVHAAQPTWVMADRVRLRQILVNLMSNAIKYNRDGGSVRVRYRMLAEPRVWLAVSDTGSGIAPEQMVKLFTPFERLGREESTIGGTGIGLALSKRLAELMHSQLGVESNEGEGSTFWLNLPMAVPATHASLDETALSPDSRRPALRVLYVEDNRANLALMQEFFSKLPHLTLLTAQDGLRGVAMAKAELPDLILLDIQLPHMDGYAVLQALKREPATRNIPVVALTADAMPHDIKRGEAAGFSAYLVKPVRLNEVASVVDELVGVGTLHDGALTTSGTLPERSN